MSLISHLRRYPWRPWQNLITHYIFFVPITEPLNQWPFPLESTHYLRTVTDIAKETKYCFPFLRQNGDGINLFYTLFGVNLTQGTRNNYCKDPNLIHLLVSIQIRTTEHTNSRITDSTTRTQTSFPVDKTHKQTGHKFDTRSREQICLPEIVHCIRTHIGVSLLVVKEKDQQEKRKKILKAEESEIHVKSCTIFIVSGRIFWEIRIFTSEKFAFFCRKFFKWTKKLSIKRGPLLSTHSTVHRNKLERDYSWTQFWTLSGVAESPADFEVAMSSRREKKKV